MVRNALNSILILTLLLCASCSKNVTLPIKTSLGDLTKIEHKDKATTTKETLTAKPGEVLYVLSFEGKKEFEVKDVAVPELARLTGGLSDASDIRLTDFSVGAAPGLGDVLLPLVDSSGKEFKPMFFGTPNAEGVLSNDNIKFNGSVTGKDGKPWVRSGKMDFPEGKVTVVYAIPEKATLTLKDGAQKHAIN